MSRFAADFPFIQISGPKGLRVQNSTGGKIQCAHMLRRQRLFVPNENPVRRMVEVIPEAHRESRAVRWTRFSLADGMCGSCVRKEA